VHEPIEKPEKEEPEEDADEYPSSSWFTG